MSRVEDANQIQKEIECNNQCMEQTIQNLVDEGRTNLFKIKTNRSSKFPISNFPINSMENPNQIFPNSTNSGNSNNSENSQKWG